MKYTFHKEGKVEMVSIEVDATNVVTRPATEQDHEDAKEHDAAAEHLSAADKQVVQDEADAEVAHQKKKR
jgi:hypothetical protein